MTRWKSRRYWRGALAGAAAITAVSDEEAAAVRAMLGEGAPPGAGVPFRAGVPAVSVVPNGVDAGGYVRRDGAQAPGRLIYNGALTYRPNLDAVRWFAREILPRVAADVPEAHLVVTGRSGGDEARDLRENDRIRLTGFLPDIAPALEAAALCVVPLRHGGGTRLKVLEAFAAGLPVVATSLGAAGIAARDGEHLLLADTPDAFAGAVVRLLRQPREAGALALRARHLVRERYDWSGIAGGLSDLLESVGEQEVRAV